MSYEKTTWQDGDVITSTKLNNMENGIAGNDVMVLTVDENKTLNYTWQEIHDANLVFLAAEVDAYCTYYFRTQTLFNGREYEVEFVSLVGATPSSVKFTADDANEYPVLVDI